MGPRALRLVAGYADGWEASYVTPAGFAARWEQLIGLLGDEGRPADALRRSVELDAVAVEEGESATPSIDRFRVSRGLDQGHPLLDTVLAGDATALVARMASYEAAGATDLMLGFADFPSTGMLETFGRTVLHGRASHATASSEQR
jgi:hypothetical protein